MLSQAYGRTAIKINLNQIPSSPPEIPLGVNKQNSNSKSKDFIWVQEGLVVDNHTYYIVGIYVKGGSAKKLGHWIEFRSMAELSYKLDSGARFGIAIYHLSNASLDDFNPGTEVISFSYTVPMKWHLIYEVTRGQSPGTQREQLMTVYSENPGLGNIKATGAPR